MRLTEKYKENYVARDNCKYAYEIYQKLGQLEDVLEKYKIDTPQELDKDLEMCHRLVYEYGQIEEELGIDLVTLFKALKQGYIWYDDEKYKIECLYMKPQIHLYVADGVGGCYMEDYGKTWALTKEELLNGR